MVLDLEEKIEDVIITEVILITEVTGEEEEDIIKITRIILQTIVFRNNFFLLMQIRKQELRLRPKHPLHWHPAQMHNQLMFKLHPPAQPNHIETVQCSSVICYTCGYPNHTAVICSLENRGGRRRGGNFPCNRKPKTKRATNSTKVQNFRFFY